MKEEIEFLRADKHPIYLAEFTVFHDCWSRGLRRPMIEQDLKEVKIDIVYNGKYDPNLKRVRFVLGKLVKEDVIDILKNGIRLGIIKKARVWINGNTTFELVVKDDSLNTMLDIEKHPFGELLKYSVMLHNETPYEFYRLYVPSIGDVKAREIIRSFEDKLNNYGEASLEKLERISEYKLSDIDQPKMESFLSMFKDSEIKLLATALELGYFDVPKKATLDDLAVKLNMPRTKINEELRNVTRKISKAFIDNLRQFYVED